MNETVLIAPGVIFSTDVLRPTWAEQHLTPARRNAAGTLRTVSLSSHSEDSEAVREQMPLL